MNTQDIFPFTRDGITYDAREGFDGGSIQCEYKYGYWCITVLGFFCRDRTVEKAIEELRDAIHYSCRHKTGPETWHSVIRESRGFKETRNDLRLLAKRVHPPKSFKERLNENEGCLTFVAMLGLIILMLWLMATFAPANG